MPTYPKDLTDLQLAPLVLAVDQRLDELELLDLQELGMRVAMDTNSGGGTRAIRLAALLETVGHLLDDHGWTMAWSMRGIRLTHHWHHVTLGVPPTFAHYIEGTRPKAWTD